MPTAGKPTWLLIPPVLLTPKERREYMLNHIEDGQFYAIFSLRNFDTTIVCAKRYEAEEKRLYCYAYLWISGNGVYNLHVSDPHGIIKLRDFLGDKPYVSTTISTLPSLSLKRKISRPTSRREISTTSCSVYRRLGLNVISRRAKIMGWALTNIA